MIRSYHNLINIQKTKNKKNNYWYIHKISLKLKFDWFGKILFKRKPNKILKSNQKLLNLLSKPTDKDFLRKILLGFKNKSNICTWWRKKNSLKV